MSVTPDRPARTRVAEAPAAGPRRRRWHRVAIPFGALLLFWVTVAVIHLAEQPDLGDPGTLSPTGTGPDGSSELARRLAERGVRVQTVTSGPAAVRAADGAEGATVFVPAPGFVSMSALADLGTLEGAHRVVVVRPGLFSMIALGAPIGVDGERWAATTEPPDCATDYAQQAGPAAARRTRYGVFSDSFPFEVSTQCYGGGIVGVRNHDLEVVYIGATDPFRNSRIGEHGNAALATGLLGAGSRLIWLDLHERDPVQGPDVRLNPGQIELPQYDRGDQDRTQTGFPTIDAFPQVLWSSIVLAALVALLTALAWARRLGPPVAEPLPVLVPAAESVTGRGRLYDRVDARGATLDALRGAAITRLARLVFPFAGAAPERDLLHAGPAADAFVAQLQARTGLAADAIQATLYGPEPDDDAALAAAVADLDSLVNAALRDDTGPAAHGRRPS